MINKKTIKVEVDMEESIECDVCGLSADSQDCEYQEFTKIKFGAGYGSIFGDGNIVEIDICQNCLKKTFGDKLRISEYKSK